MSKDKAKTKKSTEKTVERVPPDPEAVNESIRLHEKLQRLKGRGSDNVDAAQKELTDFCLENGIVEDVEDDETVEIDFATTPTPEEEE